MIQMETLPFVPRCMKIITAPQEFFRNQLDKNITPAIMHLVLVTLVTILIVSIGSIISGIITSPLALIGGGGASAIGASIVGSIIGGFLFIVVGTIIGIPFTIVSAFIGALIAHLFLYLLGAKGGWERTFKVVCYLSTFSLVTAAISIIPFLGAIISIGLWLYVLYITIQAYSLQHQMTMLMAGIAVILPMIIFGLIALVIVAIVGAALFNYLSPMMANAGVF